MNQYLTAQIRGSIIDQVSKKPIPYVNIYTSDGNKVYGTTTDENGYFSINFEFKYLTISHISYEKVVVKKQDLGEVIYLNPLSVTINDGITVSAKYKQPKWIKRKLEKIVENKAKNYRNKDKVLFYNYNTNTLNDSNAYAFKSNGYLYVPALKKNLEFKINPQTNVVKYKDQTAGTNFENLKQILYDDFVVNFNKQFISSNRFIQNKMYNNDNPIVKLLFQSNKFIDDNGFLIVDTLKDVILEVELNFGTEHNVKSHTSYIYRTFASSIGFNYNNWITKIHIKYNQIEDCYFPVDYRYKYYMKTTTKTKKGISSWFGSTEAELQLNNTSNKELNDYKLLIRPLYIGVITKKMRLADEALSKGKLPLTYEKY